MKDLPKSIKENTEKSNANFAKHTMDLMTLEPINIRYCPAEKIQERCVEYFQMCVDNDMKPTLAGFALALGTTRDNLSKYVRREWFMPDDSYEVIVRFYSALVAYIEECMMSGKVNPVGLIFLMKNNFGYKDQQDIVVNNEVKEAPTEEKLIEEANLLLEATQQKAKIDD